MATMVARTRLNVTFINTLPAFLTIANIIWFKYSYLETTTTRPLNNNSALETETTAEPVFLAKVTTQDSKVSL